MKNLITLMTAATLLINAGSTFADKASAKAQQDFDVQTAVAVGSKAWRDAFNAGDAKAAAALYEEDAIMVVKPFGEYKGRKAIQAFWEDIIAKGFDDVIYIKPNTKVMNDTSASISAGWTMNNASGVITNELWVVQPNGKALMREDHFEIAQ
ncbi:SgcJ/EcaC family oxidoreductase [Agarilytica rhodophyticola]|uniref:SgcJ/EcaC family oxidoreductase n=1 Tax=Agarilytica rhodophyticola TaxID=1737490 RepID=UPI000B344106|nr:SgcJ/EcaC family oxidoreductase [Agarilytica rhodophyticola]